MADKDIQIKINAAVDSANAAKNLGQLITALEQLEELQKGVGENTPEWKKLNTAISGTTKSLDSMRKAGTDLSATFEQVYGDLQPLTSRMGEAEDRLYELALAGRQASKEYQDLLAKVGNYKRVQQETDLVVDAASKTMTQKMVGSLSGIASGFAAAQGAMAVFGGQGQALDEVLVKVNGAMALSQGIQGLKEAGPLLMNMGKGILSIGKALLGNPIFLLAAAVVALLDSLGLLEPILDAIAYVIEIIVDGFKMLTDWLGLTTNAQNEYAEQTIEAGEKIKKDIEERGKAQEDLYNLTKDLTEEEIALLEKRLGIEIDTSNNIYDIKQENLAATNEQTKKEIDALRAIIEAGGELTDDQQKQLDERKADYAENAAEIKRIEREKQKAIIDFNKSTETTLRDFKLRNIQDERERSKATLQIREEEELAKINLQIREGKRLGQDVSKLEQAKLEITKFYNNEEKKINDAAAKERADKQKEAYDKYKDNIQKQLKTLQDVEKAKVVKTEEGTKARLDAEINAINEVEKFQVKYAKQLGLTEAQITIIKEENVDKRKKFEDDYTNKIIEASNKQKLLTSEIDVLRAKTDEDRLKASIGVIEAQRDIQLSNAELTADERTKIELEAANQIEAINKQLTDMKLANNLKVLESDAIVAQTKLSQAEFEAAQTQGNLDSEVAEIENIKNLKLEALEAERLIELSNVDLTETEKAAIEEKYRQERLTAEKEASDKVKELKKQELDAQLEIGAQSVNAISSIADTVFTIKKSGLEKGSAAELAAAKKEFEVKKKLSIAAAVISTIQGVVNALTTSTVVPDPFGTILKAVNAVAVGAAGAANIAKIASSTFEGGGSAPSVATAAAPSSSTPSFQPPQFFGLGQTTQSQGGSGQAPMKVYVSEGDITNTQNRVKVIEDRAKIN